MANGLRSAMPSIRVEDASSSASASPQLCGRQRLARTRNRRDANSADAEAESDDEQQQRNEAGEQLRRRRHQQQLRGDAGGKVERRPANEPRHSGQSLGSSKLIETTTSTTTTETTESCLSEVSRRGEEAENVALVEHLGRRAGRLSSVGPRQSTGDQESVTGQEGGPIEGNKRVTTVSTIGAQSGHSRLVLALLKEGDDKFHMKVQEMRPAIFELGLNRSEASKYQEEHRRMLASLRKQEQAPVEAFLQKYQRIRQDAQRAGAQLSAERQLVYLCMLENLQACWRASLGQLEKRAQLLGLACDFYELADRLGRSVELAEMHVQTNRLEFLDGRRAGQPAKRLEEATRELRLLNKNVSDSYESARRKQLQLIELIRVIASGNLGDARVNHLISDAHTLINHISTYLEPLRKRRLQLESVLKTTTTTTTTTATRRTLTSSLGENSNRRTHSDSNSSEPSTSQAPNQQQVMIREISSFNDLRFVDEWLSLKIEQLNSSLLSSLGGGALDSRTILSKHEQILLECRAIEEATLLFNGKNVHAIKSPIIQQQQQQQQRDSNESMAARNQQKKQETLLEQQRILSTKAREAITILEARIALLRRTIDFHVRSKEATGDIGKMMRRLQVDNSLQSVEFVAHELELKDVSSVVASGATIISELQQLQLAQQHGQRSSLVSLNLVTGGIRQAIDQLQQELAHLKTVLSQRKLLLLNEDVNKMATNFNQKCNQLHCWLQNHVQSYLLRNDRLPLDLSGVREFRQTHQQLRSEVQRKTLEVEALLRSFTSLTEENFDRKLAETIQRSMDNLRRDWIAVTNCLERRSELANKYWTLLATAGQLDRSLVELQRGPASADRLPDEVRADIEQLAQQLGTQLKLLRIELQKGSGGELRSNDGDGEQRATSEAVNELNRGQMIEQAESLCAQLAARKRSLLEGRPVAAATTTGQQQSAPSSDRTADQGKPKEAKKPSEPPRFRQTLSDKWAAPFSPLVELECEIIAPGDSDNDDHYELEWLMNNFRKIPASIRHSTSRDNNRHKLSIHNFGPQCCGTFIARAWNSAGQAVSRCELRLAGMNNRQQQQTSVVEQTNVRSSGDSSCLLAHRWPPASRDKFSRRPGEGRRPLNAANEKHKAMARIVQGVESLNEQENISTTTTISTNNSSSRQEDWKLPVTESKYSAAADREQQENNIKTNTSRLQTQLDAASSPSPSLATTLASNRSISRSPLDGTPQPPRFVQPLRCQSMSPCCSRAGLLCVVVGNPPPTIEWLHNNQVVALAKCPPRQQQQSAADANNNNNPRRGNICKLTIETVNESTTSGEYTCRASNRIGQATTSKNFTQLKTAA